LAPHTLSTYKHHDEEWGIPCRRGSGERRKNRPGWWSELDLNFRDPSSSLLTSQEFLIASVPPGQVRANHPKGCLDPLTEEYRGIKGCSDLSSACRARRAVRHPVLARLKSASDSLLLTDWFKMRVESKVSEVQIQFTPPARRTLQRAGCP